MKIQKVLALSANSRVAAQFVARQLLEDPVSLALNIVRKLPHGAGKQVAQVLANAPGAGIQGLGRQLLGAQELYAPARRLLDERPQRRYSWSALQRRIASEVAISYGDIDYRDERFSPAVRARTAWDRGDIQTALDIARSHKTTAALAQKLAGEAQALEAGWLPDVPAAKPIAFTSQRVGKARVLHLLTNSLPYTQSGYTLRSHRLLGALVDAGHKVAAYTRTGYPVLIGGLAAAPSDRVDQLTYRRILPTQLGRTLPERLSQAVRALQKAVARSESMPLVHTTTNYQNGVVAAALARANNLPWVYEVRGIMEETWASRQKTEAAALEVEQSERFAKIRAKETELMLAADHVLTLSRTMKQLLVGRGVPAEKISLLPNAVSDELFDENLDPVVARRKLGLPAEGFWVGTVSSLVAYEGLDTLLRAVALARSADKDVRVLIAGDGVARPGLEKLAAELGIEEQAHFLGKLPSSQAPIAHQGLDVFCVPRTNDRVCQSVTPLKPIEAMALGRPVIMSDIPPLAELVDNGLTGATGLLVEPGNPEELAGAITRLMAAAGEREKMAHNGREFARTRTWQKNAKVLGEIYERLVREKESA